MHPPVLAAHVVPRPHLQTRLAACETPVISVVAGRGWGKTTALASWREGQPTAWLRLGAWANNLRGVLRAVGAATTHLGGSIPPALAQMMEGYNIAHPADGGAAEALAADLALALAEVPPNAVLVLDEADVLTANSAGAQLLDALLRQLPNNLTVAFASHSPPSVNLTALRAQAAVSEIHAGELRFTPEVTAAVARNLVHDIEDDVCEAIHALTAGWPEAVRLVALSLRDLQPQARIAELQADRRGRVAVDAYVESEILPRLDEDLRSALRLIDAAPRFDRALATELGLHPDTPDHLVDRGVVQSSDDGRQFLVSPLADRMLSPPATTPTQALEARRAIAEALGRLGDAVGAVQTAVSSGDAELVAEMVVAHQSTLLATAELEVLVNAAQMLSPTQLTPALDEVFATAYMQLGEWAHASACLQRAAQGLSPLPSRIVWKLAQNLYLRWQIPDALAVLEEAAEPQEDDWESAIQCAVGAMVRWLTGQMEAAESLGAQALHIATTSGNPFALILAHSALAMLTTAAGDFVAAERHHADAMAHAQQVGSNALMARLQSNHASALIDCGRYADAVEALTELVEVTERSGHPVRRLLVLTNLADAHRRLGSLTTAEEMAGSAEQIGRRAATGLVVYPQLIRAAIRQTQGEVETAFGTYVEVASRARQVGDAQALVIALAGAARVAPDATSGLSYAREAVVAATGTARMTAKLSLAWAQVRVGQLDAAAQSAAWVLDEARRCGTPASQAEAMEVLACAGGDPDAADRHLESAAEIWERLDAELDRLRVVHARAVRAGDARVAAAAAERRAANGISARTVEIAGLDQVVSREQAGDDRGMSRLARVQIFTLGGFALHRDGSAVATSEWGSRKPRELLQILLARRGSRAARGVLVDLLWPGEDGDRVGNRLSAALSVLRAVLDPDKELGPDHYVKADPASIWLDLDALMIDLERFHAALGRARARHSPAAATDAGEDPDLAAAVGLYGGDFLVDAPYEDWAIPAREEARAAYLAALRELVGQATEREDHDLAIRRLLQLLAQDPYDEEGYQELISICIAAGRHGEAQRHYRQYVVQMRRLDLTPMAFPGVRGLRGIA